MAYNNENKKAQFRYIVKVYNEIKQSDIPDTQIVKHKFRDRGIFISIRTWKTIKSKKPSEIASNQLSLF
jgi:hypothetical protein